ncbi:MAG: hypothetical protein U0232_03175 [Thermomicrobiales bacterium]
MTVLERMRLFAGRCGESVVCDGTPWRYYRLGTGPARLLNRARRSPRVYRARRGGPRTGRYLRAGAATRRSAARILQEARHGHARRD